MKNQTYIPSTRTLKGLLFMLALGVTLGLGMAFSTAAHGAGLHQSTESGKMTGVITVGGSGSAGITVELRQRSNSGTDSSLATTTTGNGGTYNFASVASAPSDAFYYLRITGGKGMLAAWYTFPIIYVSGSDFTVPSVEMGDVSLVNPVETQALALPHSLVWQARTSGETYRIFIYANGKTDKPLLDSGSLGTGTHFDITEGSVPDGKYEGVVQVRDAVSGYGQSQSRFQFTIGNAPVTAAPTEVAPTAVPVDATPAATSAPASTDGSGQKPDLHVNLSADKISVVKGDKLVYRIEVQNLGDAPAQDVVLNNLLPSGVVIDSSQAKASTGSVEVTGNSVTAQLGVIAPNTKVVVEIPVSVGQDVGSNVSNQASVTRDGASDPVRSNAYIAQVTDTLTGPAPTVAPVQTSQPQPTTSKRATPQATAKSQQSAGGKQPTTPEKLPPAKLPNAPVPQTGGSFPITFAIALVIITLLARYLRGRGYRRV